MLEFTLNLHDLNLKQSERPFVQTGHYCMVHIYNISIPTVCADNTCTHWYSLANASISVVSVPVCVSLHVFVRVYLSD